MPEETEKTLKDLLPDRFKEGRTPAEEELLEKAQSGEPLDLQVGSPEINDPAKADSWGEERTIRAEFLRWICIDKKASALIDARGIQIVGARIDGRLNFEGATLPHRLLLALCFIKDGIALLDATTRSINLYGTHTGSISADRLKVEGTLQLRGGFRASGEVRLVGAKVGGDLSCSGGSFNNENGCAFIAAGIETKGSIFLGNAFYAHGEVLFVGAKVGGDFVCSGGSFNNENGDALIADGIETKRDIFLSKGFYSNGRVGFIGAKVGGDFACSFGCFNNGVGDAIIADAIDVKGSVLLNSDFNAEGTVSLVSAKVGGNFHCSYGSFSNENGDALIANGIVVQGDICLDNDFRALGKVFLVGAKVSGSFCCNGGHFNNGKGDALIGDGIDIKGSIFFRRGFCAKGKVRLPSARIGGNLDCSNGSFIYNNGVAFLAQRMFVGGNFIWRLKERPIGIIDLMHAKVGVLTDDKKSWPEPGRFLIDGFEYGALAPDWTPKEARERLAWIESQFPLANSPALEMLMEPLQNKYPIKSIWISSKKNLKKVWRCIIKLKPYGNFNNRLSFEFRPQPYEQLAKVLKNMGHESDSREVLIAKQEALRKCGNISWWRKRWHDFLGFTMAHGYKPIRPIGAMVAMILVGWVVFYLANGGSCMAQSKLSIFKDNMHLYPGFNSFIYSVDSFIPFVDLHQENYWIPAYNSLHPWWSWFMRGYLWFHISMGWLATTLAAVSLSGVVRKKD